MHSLSTSVRKSDKNGKYHIKAKIVLGEKNYWISSKGLLHKIANQKYRITGDKPSVTKTLQAVQPKTFKGKFTKKSAQAVNFAVHSTLHTAENAALFTETVTLKVTDEIERNVKCKLIQKYRQEAVDDYHRGTIATLGIAKDAALGTYRHFRQKKECKLEKARYQVKKAEYKLYIEEQFKPKLAKNRADLKADKANFKKRKKTFKNFRIEKKKSQNAVKQLKTDKKFQAKIKRKQWRIADLSHPTPIVLKPVAYTSKRMTASSWQKAIYADEDNDFLSAIDTVKRHSADRVVEKMQPYRLKKQNQKKRDKLDRNRNHSHKRLKHREDRLKNKVEHPKKVKRKPEIMGKGSFADRFKHALKEVLTFVSNIYRKEALRVLLACLVPILTVGS